MSKEVLVMILGIITAVMPYLGFPGSWRTVVLVVLGLGLTLLGFLLRRDALSRGVTTRADFFVDNRPRQEEMQTYEDSQTRTRIQ